MAWLAGIAGKAEDLLNKVDKSAAVALQKTQKSTHFTGSNFTVNDQYDDRYSGGYIPSPRLASDPLQTRSLNYAGKQQVNISSPESPKTDFAKLSSSAKSSPSGSYKKKKDTDEELMKYLNSPTTPESSKMPRRSSITSPKENTVKQSPTTVKPSNDAAIQSAPESTDMQQRQEEELGSENTEARDFVPTANLFDTLDQGEQTDDTSFPKHPAESVLDNKLDEENRSLKKELSEANQKLAVAGQRKKNLESEVKRMQERLDKWNSQVSSNESIIRELRSRESDLSGALDAKDSQLAVLRVRLQEADEELAAKRNLCEKLRTENKRLLNERSDSSDLQSQTIENLRLKLQDAEQALSSEQAHYRIQMAESMSRLSKMEEEKQSLMENLSSMQKKLSDEKTLAKDLSNQLKASKSNFESAQKELIEYKQKAQRILQSKDKLIAALKETQGSAASTSDSGEQFSFSNSLILEEVQQERDILREELQKSNSIIESLQQELQEIEQHTQRETDVIQEHLSNLQEQVKQESQSKAKIEEDFAQQSEELRFIREEFARTKANLQSRIKDREAEAEKLRKQLMTKTLNTSNESELEARLHALTESLIQKQTVVETLNTEKNSLVLQLERMEQRLKESEMALASATQTHSTVVGMSSTNEYSDQRYRRSVMFGEHPFDSNVTRKVKRAYGVLDAFSVRVGVFLRQYPVARLSVIVYMFILHLWVMIVLLTYQPEIHSSKQR